MNGKYKNSSLLGEKQNTRKNEQIHCHIKEKQT